MREQIKELFEELIERWELAEETIINDRGNLDDYDWLENEKKLYIKKMDNILLELRA